MSTPSMAMPSQERKSLPALVLGIIALVIALGGATAVLIGLLNLDRASSLALIGVGGLVFVGSTMWGVQRIRTATGISVGQQLLLANAILVFAFFYIPIIVLIIFSFNAGRVPTVWEGFSFRWYTELANDEAILRAFRNTMIVTFASTIISTIIGTMVSVAMERYNFRLKLPFDAVLYMPIIIPDIVIALATLL
ncbi:MAG TPA: hypothetical protein VGD99_22555, partial [Anaerolineae bacterium]